MARSLIKGLRIEYSCLIGSIDPIRPLVIYSLHPLVNNGCTEWSHLSMFL